MKLGALLMPSHPPGRDIREGAALDLADLEVLDRLGFDEAWIGEHFTTAWEPCPSPDLLIAQALQRTESIRLGPLGHLLPYHHPIELAHRVAYLDHLAGGRYQLGVGVSALPSDREIFDLPKVRGVNREMTFESLDMMTRLWKSGPFAFRGKFWSAGVPTSSIPHLGYHLNPFQDPHPPIAIAGLTPGSENHRLAGEKGYIPVSLSVSPDPAVTAGHWAAVEEGAARVGCTPDRSQWRVIRDICVAPTDAEARAMAVDGMMGRCWREFLLPVYLGLGLGPLLKIDPEMSDDEVDPDYLAENLWFVGSPETVARKIADLYDAVGGFGYIVPVVYESRDERAAWVRSMELLFNEVVPLLPDVPGSEK